ncbi:MAG: AraC family transcriptional regulator [Pseudomonadales bacterium]|nr:AraC family transcriptional regulator [Pseudomonadales bacterium]
MIDKTGQDDLIRLGREHTIASHFAWVRLQNALQLGLSVENLVLEAHLPLSILQEPGVRISPQQLALLYRGLWKACGDEYFGLTQTSIRVGVFELVAEQMIACENLQTAMLKAIRIYSLVTDNVIFSMEREGENVRFVVTLKNPELDKENSLIEFLLLVWHRFPSWLVGETVPLKEVQFAYAPPPHREEYQLLFPGPCVFNQPVNALVWPVNALEWPIRRSPDHLQRYLEQVPLPWFLKQRYAESLTDKVIQLLDENLSERLLTLEEIAQKLHVTTRTLRRKLTAEKSSFRKLKDDVRRDKAIYWLSQESVPIAKVGRACGYTEATAFIRAFRQWTGITPGDYRKRLFKI